MRPVDHNYDFVTRKVQITIAKHDYGQDAFFEDLGATVTWGLEIDARSWGVKGFNPFIKALLAAFEVELPGQEQPVFQELVSDVGTEFRIDGDVLRAGDHLYPREASLWIAQNKIVRAIISF